ncbi:MAG: hypothetical protein ACPH5P_07145, partial [Akkermansiaceae bacterium]
RILKKKSKHARRHPELYDPEYKRGEVSSHSLGGARLDRSGSCIGDSVQVESETHREEERDK